MTDNKEKMVKWHVPVMLSGVYEFDVYAKTVEEACEKVAEGEVDIDYERLRQWVTFDYGYIDPMDAYILVDNYGVPEQYEQLEIPFSN